MANINLRDVEKARLSITKDQEKEILKLYESVYKDVKKQIDSIPQEGVSSSLRRMYLSELSKQLKRAYEKTGKSIEGKIKDSISQISQTVVENNDKWMKGVGISVEGAYSWVPEDIVSMLSSGKLYDEDWSLSKAIWGESKKKAHDIDQVVARGVTANKSAYDIAKDLERYVNPKAKKDWEWSKVYPGTSKKVDYNAQRLARTMVSHAYQQSLLATTKNNPFVTGYRWRSAHTHRTCEICNERDGKIYSADDLPLDHPNGMCTFIAELSGNMENIADRLGDWANGGNDTDIDRWYHSMNSGEHSFEGKWGKRISPNERIRSLLPYGEPGIYAKIDRDLKNVKNLIVESHDEKTWKSLRKRISSLNEKQIQYLKMGNPFIKEIVYEEGKNRWYPNLRLMILDLRNDEKNPKKVSYSSFFHEYGHLLDSSLLGVDEKISSGDKVGKSLYELIKREYDNLIDSQGELLDFIRKDLENTNSSSMGVQDIISGLSNDYNRVCWGHPEKYWMKGLLEDRWKRVTSETFANLTMAYFLPEARESFLKYFPKTYKFYSDFVDGVMKSK